MPIVSKKVKALQKDILIKNQIITLLNKSNTPNTQQTLQQSTANSNYYVSLYQNDNKDLSFNTTSNSLITKNLVIQNQPACYVDASNSYDLVNKSQMNKYAGFDLSAGYRFYSEDWIRGDVSGNFNWIATTASSGTVTTIASDISHVGIVKLGVANNNSSSTSILTLPITTWFFSKNIKSIRYLVRPLSDNNYGNATAHVGISSNVNGLIATASWYYSSTTSSASPNKWECYVNNISQKYLSTFGVTALNSTFATKWVLFEIEFDSLGYPSFYITLLGVTNRTLVHKETINVVDTTSQLRPYIYIKNNSGNPKTFDIDYIDWVVSP
uniref:Uncharacterized protein n=1 Tax=viral metagenome TaxID=1070528 RepID=A0A6C0DNI2_9ZZZZ